MANPPHPHPPPSSANIHHPSPSSFNHMNQDFSELLTLLNDVQSHHIHQLVEFLGSASLDEHMNAIVVPTRLANANLFKRGWSWLEGTVLANKDRDLPKFVGCLLQSVGKTHWALSGLFFVGIALERWVTMKSNKPKCVRLLCMMNTIAVTLHQLEHHFGESSQVIQQAMRLIIENTILCCDYLRGKAYRRFWKAKTMEQQISEAQHDLDAILTSVNCKGNLTILNSISEFRQSIKNISEEFNYYTPSPENLLNTDPVGIHDQVKKVRKLMKIDGVDEKAVCVIIWGLGGLGKSTLAKDFIRSLQPWPQHLIFSAVELDNTIKEGRPTHIAKLQEEIANKLTGKKVKIGNPNDGKSKLKEVLEQTSSFLFVDNVNTKADIKMLLPEELCLKDGSTLRILPTARDRQLQEFLPRGTNIREHSMRHLSPEDGLALLRRAFKESDSEFQEKFQGETLKLGKIADLCHGIPLLLNIAGEQLKDERKVSFYKKLIRKLEKGDLLKEQEHYYEKAIDVLLFVFNLLDTEVKEAFLDFCIYFSDVLWRRKEIHPYQIFSEVFDSEMNTLVKRGLMNRDGRRSVHDILKELAVKQARKCYTLSKKEWKVASNHKAWADVKGIRLGYFDDREDTAVITVESAALDATHASLRLLVIDGNKVRLRGKCYNSFEKLRFLQLKNVKAEFLFECLHMFINLKYVCLVGCDNVPNEIFSLPSLTILRLLNCKELKQLPDEIVEAESLKELRISGSPIIELPENFSNLTSLEICEVGGTQLQSLSNDIGKSLSALKDLRLQNNIQLMHLPESFGELQQLETLVISNCPLERLPESFKRLTSLNTCVLEGLELKTLPEEIGMLQRLQWLQISRLPITDICFDFEGLTNLTALYINSCKELKKLSDSIGHLHRLTGRHNLYVTEYPVVRLFFVFKAEMVKGNVVAANILRCDPFPRIRSYFKRRWRIDR